MEPAEHWHCKTPAEERSAVNPHGSGAAIADAGRRDQRRVWLSRSEMPCRPKATPIHELERYMRCKDCSQVRGYAYKRSHLVALRAKKISASDPPSTSRAAGL
jgi:hypothetical protein